MKLFPNMQQPMRDKLNLLGVGLSQMSAGQGVNLGPAQQAIAKRQQDAAMRAAMENLNISSRFTPDQQAILATMPPAAALQVLTGEVFRKPAAPTKGIEVGGSIVNPITGELIYQGPKEATERKTYRAADGFLYYDDGSRVLPNVTGDQNFIVTGEQAAGYGLAPEKTWNVTAGASGVRATEAGGGGVTVENNLGGTGEEEFLKEMARNSGKFFGSLIEQGAVAQGQLGQINTIEALLADGDIGGTADAWRSWAQNTLGVQISGGRQEALNALINQLVPGQRPPGSGQMSDKDLELFKQSLPSLVNSPEGNMLILETMRGMAQFKRAQAEIATAVSLGAKTREEGLEELLALPDPLAGAVSAIEAMQVPDEEEPDGEALTDGELKFLSMTNG